MSFRPGSPGDTLLALAAGVEKNSQHPLAVAVVKAAQERGVTIEPATGFDTFGGRGVAATVLGETVLVGQPGVPAGKSREDPCRDRGPDHGARTGGKDGRAGRSRRGDCRDYCHCGYPQAHDKGRHRPAPRHGDRCRHDHGRQPADRGSDRPAGRDRDR